MNYEENVISCLHAFTFYLIYTVLYQMQNMLNSFFFHQREYCLLICPSPRISSAGTVQQAPLMHLY